MAFIQSLSEQFSLLLDGVSSLCEACNCYCYFPAMRKASLGIQLAHLGGKAQ